MNAFIELLPSIVNQGLILSLPALGIMIPFRLLNLADITCEGSYALGGCLAAIIISNTQSVALAILFAILGAGLSGIVTALLYYFLRIHSLLSGVIVITMIYSINLHILGTSNIALFNIPTLFSHTLFSNAALSTFVPLALIIMMLLLLFFRFITSHYGLRLRAVGANPKTASLFAINPLPYVLLGFFIANAINGLAGALMVQYQSYADVGMGFGILIHALAALMLGEVVVGRHSLSRQLLSPIVGGILYQAIISCVLIAGISPSDLKFITGIMIIGILSIRNHTQGVQHVN